MDNQGVEEEAKETRVEGIIIKVEEETVSIIIITKIIKVVVVGATIHSKEGIQVTKTL